MKKFTHSALAATFGFAISTSVLADTVFLAGATGVMGKQLAPLLVKEGHTVYGTTRSPAKAKELEQIGVKPVVLDVYDNAALEKAVLAAKPDVVINELSDLPKGLKEEELEAGLKRDARIRIEGTRNLIAAAEKAGVKKYIGASHAFLYVPVDNKPATEDTPMIKISDPFWGETMYATLSMEEQIRDSKMLNVTLRYGWLYGPNTGFDTSIDGYPSLHVQAAAKATVEAMKATKSAVYNVAEDSPLIDNGKFKKAFPQWRSDFRF